jgi:GTP-binding protein Era
MVAIAGRPNVGKSTLMNALLGQKLSIVSPRPQTTRHRIMGILSEPGFQAVFLDTPGLLTPKYALQESMIRTARHSVEESDLVLFLSDASSNPLDDLDSVRALPKTGVPIFWVINKIDKLPKSTLLPVIDRGSVSGLFQEIVPISALKKDGTGRLLELIVTALPVGEPYFPTDVVSQEPERFYVSEIIREAIFHRFGEEIPYSSAVVVEAFEEKPDRKDYIRAKIVLERDSQKGIIIGKGGSALKDLGRRSREGIEVFLGRPVYLELRVVVEPNWRKDFRKMKGLGYR